ncbi:MAG: hypothetical protein ABFS56_11750 [Pseudomonadota bacterium]
MNKEILFFQKIGFLALYLVFREWSGADFPKLDFKITLKMLMPRFY